MEIKKVLNCDFVKAYVQDMKIKHLAVIQNVLVSSQVIQTTHLFVLCKIRLYNVLYIKAMRMQIGRQNWSQYK